MLYKYRNDPSFPDRYTPESNWVKLLPVGGRPLQSAEVIEVQSIIQSNASSILSSTYKNGTILSGLSPTVSTTSSDLSISISAGLLYLDAIAIRVESRTLVIPKTGTHTIGVLVSEEIITEEEDSSLRDPNRGGSLYGTEGAARLKWVSSLVVNDSNAYPILSIQDGVIINLSPPNLSTSNIAQYVYDRDGHFKVSGLAVVYSKLIPGASTPSRTTELITDRNEALQAISNIESSISQASTRLTNLSIELELVPNPSTRYEDLLKQVEDANESIARLSTDLIQAQANLATIVQELVAITPTNSDKEQVLVSPGVAYVEGYRVSVPVSTLLDIPKQLPVQRIVGARYSYVGTRASTTRMINLGTATSINQVKSASTLITLEFTNIAYETQLIPIRVSFLLTPARVEINSIEDVVSLISRSISTPSLIPSHINYSTRTGIDLPKQVLRELLSRSVVLTQVTNSLVISNRIDTRAPIGVTVRLSNATLSTDTQQSFLVNNTLNQYQLGYRPVASIESVSSEIEVIDYPVTRHATKGGIDKLGDDTVFHISSIKQGTTTYAEGRDYRLSDHSAIDWSGNSVDSLEPLPGSTYYVTYAYTQELSTEDYNLSKDSIVLTNNRPSPGYSFQVTYTYYLSQVGMVLLSKTGLISYVLGPASVNPIAPAVPTNQLALASFRLYRDGLELLPINNSIWRVKDLHNLSTRIKTLGVANELLKAELTNSIDSINSIGQQPISVFSDSLIEIDSIDLDNSSLAIYPSLLSIGPPINRKDVPLSIDSSDTYITMPYSEVTLVKQDRSTRALSVGAIKSNGKGLMKAYPSTIFLSKPVSTVAPIDPVSARLDPLTRSSSNLLVSTLRSVVPNLFLDTVEAINESILNGTALPNITDQDANSYTGFLSTINEVGIGTITLEVTNLPPGLDGHRLVFSGVPITNYLLLLDTSEGPLGIRSNRLGEVRLSFQVPEGTKPGLHSIELIGPNSYSSSSVSIYNNIVNQALIAAIQYWGSEPVSNTPTSYLPISLPTNLGPRELYESVNQSFVSPSYALLTSVSIKLRSLSSTTKPYLRVREYKNRPLGNILATGKPSELYTTNDSSTATTIPLDNPLLVEPGKSYSIGIGSSGKGTSIYSSVIGEPDLLSSSTIGLQPLQQGELWISSDGISLATLDNELLSYELRAALFNNEPLLIDLGTYGVSNSFPNITHACLNTRDICPPLTSIQYQYSTGAQWVDIQPNIPFLLLLPSSNIRLRATLYSSNPSISPLLLTKGCSLSLMSYRSNTTLVSKVKQVSLPYQTVEVIVDHTQPLNSSLVAYTASSANNWLEMPLVSSTLIDQVASISRTKFKLTLPLSSTRVLMYYKLSSVNTPTTSNPLLIRQVISYVY